VLPTNFVKKFPALSILENWLQRLEKQSSVGVHDLYCTLKERFADICCVINVFETFPIDSMRDKRFSIITSLVRILPEKDRLSISLPSLDHKNLTKFTRDQYWSLS
jgi:hypothetical protein